MELARLRNMLKIDELDAKIVTELQADGRRPNVEIARRLGVAEGTVRKRIHRLVREKIIQIGAWPDPLKVGYQTYALIEIQVKLADIERAAERLSRSPEIFFLGTCMGGCDIIAAACFRSAEHIHEFMTRRLARIPGIQRTVTSSLTRIVKRDYTFTIPVGYANQKAVGKRSELTSRASRIRKR